MRLFLSLAALLAGCAADDGPSDDASGGGSDSGSAAVTADYAAPGPATPGTFESTLSGSTGATLTVQAWYPAEDSDAAPITYDSAYQGGAIQGATPACDGPRPVLVFSHGNGGVRWQSPFFTEHLASHGWVVAAPDHLGNTLFDMGTVDYNEIILRRPLDVQDTFDWVVAQSDDPNSPLYGCVDAAAGYAVAGHSFGGFTTYATAGAPFDHPETGATEDRGDDRVWAALAMAPWDVFGILGPGNANITVPVMTLGGTRDATTPWSMISGLHDQLTVTPRYLGEFPDAGHYSFAPVSCLLYTEDGCGDDFLALDTFTALVNASGLAFLEGVRGEAEAFDQIPMDHPELSFVVTE